MSKNLNNNNLSFQGIKFINHKNKVNNNLLLNKQSKTYSLFKKFNNILAVLIITVLVVPLNLFAGLSNNMPASDFFSNINNKGLNRPFDVLIDTTNHRLFVADFFNYRVVVYNLNNDNTLPDRVADYVLGHTDLNGTQSSSNQAMLIRPRALAFDSVNNRLFVSEDGPHRVKVFDLSGGITNGMNASYVLGQPDFDSYSSSITQNGFTWPVGLSFDLDNERLFVANSNRIQVFDLSGGITNGMNASYVLGQSDFTSSASADTQNGFNGVFDVKYDSVNSYLYASENSGNRVKVFDLSGGITNGMNASYVLGQPDFISLSANNTQNGLNAPRDIALDQTGNRLFVAERNGHRVKVFDVATIVNGENAVNVLGQADFTSASAANTQAGLNTLEGGIDFDSTNNRLFVAESNGAHRVKIFDVTAITDGENAVDLLGQLDGSNNPIYTTAAANNIQSVSATNFNNPTNGELDLINHRLFVPEFNNNRVLVFNLDNNNLLVDKTPDYVLGQADFTTNTANHTQNGLSTPYGVAFDSVNNRLFVSEYTGSRVKVFDVATIVNGENAINVIGQADFTSNTTATTQAGLSNPGDVVLDTARQHLYVMDQSNNRVMVYNIDQSVLIPNVTNGPNAINVLGQSDYTSSATSVTANQLGGNTQSIAYIPSLDKLFVSSYTADRVLVFDVATIVNGENAVNVLGQNDFTTHAGDGLISQNQFYNPNKVVFDSFNKRLFIADESNRRIMVFDITNGITNGMNASYVLGRPNFDGPVYSMNRFYSDSVHGLAFDQANQRLYGFSHSNFIVIWDFSADLTSTTPILASVDTTPNYTFNTNEAGQITYGGSCSSATTVATVGNNTITLNQLSPGNYSNCTITITDNFGNVSSTHTIPTFDIVVHSGGSSSTPTTSTTITESTINNTVTPPVLENTTTEVTTTVLPPTNTYTSPIDGTTKSCPAFTKYLRVGSRLNDKQEARLWQAFLNTKEEEKLKIDGIYGKQTESAIKRFQNKYKDFILSPWNLISPTGYTYQSTRAYANKLINCSEGVVTLDNGKVINY